MGFSSIFCLEQRDTVYEKKKKKKERGAKVSAYSVPTLITCLHI